MRPDNGKHCIIERAYGRTTVLACTMENAHAILRDQWDYIHPDVTRIASTLAGEDGMPPHRFVTTLQLAFALKGLLHANEGVLLPELQRVCHGPRRAPAENPDLRPSVRATADMRHELLDWLCRHGISTERLEALHAELSRALSKEALSFLSPAMNATPPVEFVDSVLLEGARELATILRAAWNENAETWRIASRILKFVGGWTHRDVSYEVAEFLACSRSH